MTEHEEPKDGSAERLDGRMDLDEELRAIFPQLDAAWRLDYWEEVRRAALRDLERRHEQEQGMIAASKLAAYMHADVDPSERTWLDTIGYRVYGEICLRIRLYQADLAIRHLQKSPGSKVNPQSYRRMEEAVFAAMAEERQSILERILPAEERLPGDELADGGTPEIVGGSEGENLG